MTSDFDIAACTYDEDFTHSNIGKLQRNRVWDLLNQTLEGSHKMKVLELNCGTGEDAMRFAKKGNSVIATDISEVMLKVGRSKNGYDSIKFMRLDLNNMDSVFLEKEFDLVFSNFGGLNCIHPDSLQRLGDSVAKVLKPSGKFIAVVMPKVCLWESLYLILKGKVSETFRRNKGFAEVNVSGKDVKTWYYNPSVFSKLIGQRFKTQVLRPIGLFIPPSYMESFFRKNKRLLTIFNAFEILTANFPWQAQFSDHYYIEFIKE